MCILRCCNNCSACSCDLYAAAARGVAVLCCVMEPPVTQLVVLLVLVLELVLLVPGSLSLMLAAPIMLACLRHGRC